MCCAKKFEKIKTTNNAKMIENVHVLWDISNINMICFAFLVICLPYRNMRKLNEFEHLMTLFSWEVYRDKNLIFYRIFENRYKQTCRIGPIWNIQIQISIKALHLRKYSKKIEINLFSKCVCFALLRVRTPAIR